MLVITVCNLCNFIKAHQASIKDVNLLIFQDNGFEFSGISSYLTSCNGHVGYMIWLQVEAFNLRAFPVIFMPQEFPHAKIISRVRADLVWSGPGFAPGPVRFENTRSGRFLIETSSFH